MYNSDDVEKGVFDAFYNAAQIASNAALCYQDAGEMAARPSVVLKAKVYPDGDMWCALYGDNIQEGVCGFGKTPDKACRDFDNNWKTQEMNPR